MQWRQLLKISPVAIVIGLLVFAGTQSAAEDNAVEARMRADLNILASDEYEGRGVGTKGLERAADYIAGEFKRAGLKPGGMEGTWYQPFKVAGRSSLGKKNTLTLRGPQGQTIAFRQGADFQVMGSSGGGKVSAPLVFVGYGATAPQIKYDDFKDIDVEGKIVVILRHAPRWNNKYLPFDGQRKTVHAGLIKKQSLAELNKATALLLVNDRSELRRRDKLMPFNYIRGATSGGNIPAFHVRRSVLDPIFRSSLGTSLGQMEAAIDRDLKPRSGNLSGWTASLEASVKRNDRPVKNVVGVLEGNGPLAKETIVIGAHYDHLGYGGRGSRAKNKKKQIHNGADDNASGTTALMELARRFGKTQGPRRRLVFMAFSAEEMGLLGSRHYCNKQPLFPLADTAAMVNLDMVGRLPTKGKEKLIIGGTGTAKSFDALIDKLNQKQGFTLVKKKSGIGPSDHASFYRKKIPVFFFFTDLHADYHRPSDDADKVNVQGMRRITDLAEELVAHLSAAKRPEYVLVKGGGGTRPRGNIPKMGIIPDYASDKEGVQISGVAADGPAAKAGFKAGDRIVEIAGKSVRNLQGYMVIMATQKRGQPLTVGVMRNNKKVTLKVIPQ